MNSAVIDESKMHEPKSDGAILSKLDIFPPQALVGSCGELARVMARDTEVPEEFYFACSLTILGAICSAELGLEIALESEPRLYTVLLGESYSVKKSTAMRNALKFFPTLKNVPQPHLLYGVGSAEGLAREFTGSKNVLCAFDELRSLMDKCKIQNSSLLPMVASLFENQNWDNPTKDQFTSSSIRDAHLSLIGCCTTDTYSSMWSNEAIAIGFPNRLFVVNADRKGKVAWPKAPDPRELDQLRIRIQQQHARLPQYFEIDPEAEKAWERWYTHLPSSEHTKRLDTIGFHLFPLIALTTDKNIIDAETVDTVTKILDYEFYIRRITDPIDADNTIAKLEEKVRRVLASHGSMKKREIRNKIHADRNGLWAFDQALKNLISAGDVTYQDNTFSLITHP